MPNYNSYYLYQKYIKYPSNPDYVPVYPTEYSVSGDSENPMPLVIKQENAVECGYKESIYRWFQSTQSGDTLCYEGDKYYKEFYQVSYDNGRTWQNVIPEQSRRSSVVYEDDADDCYEYRWTNLDISRDYICDDCPQLKLKATYSDSTTYYVECNSSTTLTEMEVIGHTTPISSMTSAEVGSCVEIIGEAAFYGSSSLTNIEIPDSVTSIGVRAFYRCRSLTSVNIPSGVTSIGNSAFASCSGLTGVTVNAVTPPTLGSSAFSSTNNCPIYVPASAVEAYKTAWSGIASRIYPIP